MAQGLPWTGADEIRLRKAIADGLSREALAEQFVHPLEGIRRKCIRLGLKFPRAPQRPQEPTERVREPSPEKIVRSTKALGDAINALIDRMPANDVAIMLGKPHLVIPGTERVLKTCAVERIAA